MEGHKECLLCEGEMEEEPIEDDKLERLREDNKHLDGKEVHKLVCSSCGHTAYVTSGED